MITEREYINKTSLSHRKKYAQFFTPEPIADFMAQWVLTDAKINMDILEPAYGLGVFSRSLSKYNKDLCVKGYDIDKTIIQYAQLNASEIPCPISLENDNYLTSTWDSKYDGIICNPPYLKFHDYDNTTLVSLVNSKLHTQLNGFTNIYTLFLLKSIFQLKEGGRLAYIIPSEFLNSDYGVEVKRALLASGVLQHLIIVDFTQCAFDDALTTACILFCQKSKQPSEAVKFSNINNVNDLPSSLENFTSIYIHELNPEIKWKQYYEESQSSKYNHLVPFSTFAKVSRGIATGANDYFTFKASKKDLYRIPDECFRPCICHAADVKSQIFTTADLKQLEAADKAVALFDGCVDEKDANVKSYLKLGVENKINEKYLTASRSPWYALENRPPSPIWVSVFNRNGLRFVRNLANAYNLTTFHCVYNISVINTDILFAYLMTDVAKEIFIDNSRQYGNGLVKFEPNDLNKGKVVDLRLLTAEETNFISDVYQKLQHYGTVYQQCVELLNEFFVEKYIKGINNLEPYIVRLEEISGIKIAEKVKEKTERVKQLNLFDLFDQYNLEPITQNNVIGENEVAAYGKKPAKCPPIDLNKNLLVCNVKKDNWKQFLDGTAEIYYTGKKFPSTVALNKLYYFVPYISGKGIRDLYYIKIARLGYRKEGQAEEDKKDIRLVFEIEFVKHLFEDYKPVKLKIWRTYTDTILSEIL